MCWICIIPIWAQRTFSCSQIYNMGPLNSGILIFPVWELPDTLIHFEPQQMLHNKISPLNNVSQHMSCTQLWLVSVISVVLHHIFHNFWSYPNLWALTRALYVMMIKVPSVSNFLRFHSPHHRVTQDGSNNINATKRSLHISCDKQTNAHN